MKPTRALPTLAFLATLAGCPAPAEPTTGPGPADSGKAPGETGKSSDPEPAAAPTSDGGETTAGKPSV